ncbi:transcription factor TFIIF complex subunit Tfg3 [Ophidiomyces ophidiicola]|uniref:Transcription factor TFIIF complex subunit Tfg3 n=1 Tax=Ophidiomyces ophidiicola TaxID=1387563 RepID=A0ACB8UUB0_9EURO|nr:transcription factor TFIIF complex subunit Tfg3 [Ophidiomyces ophidiicola]KAI1945153.1 transcription factor TFIIF complex subunit Tfg3 [Ophidiomyces ophidiicola]KAI1946911.1 transcription factor TFIIF complex subunit Tfg3 [Ophidiomyces ophidiicola]KAI1971542.1 transcription factor TFIIF complex subunit Tfg3 [Ophidiomyces ophidiicola]KAI2019329.1 transcription factor TFIIF complex subunit Tfg3 [Ophidiomyces ophidiicola]KAI2050359.1 transcription factor TFIIF complex subunit Tfg3 [Ophidiomyce
MPDTLPFPAALRSTTSSRAARVRNGASPSLPPAYLDGLWLIQSILQVKRTVKLVTEQNPTDKASEYEGLPVRRWSIEVFLLNEHGEEIPATLFNEVTYTLHPSFGERAVQTFKTPPFRIEEEGWGEFDLQVGLGAPDKEHTVPHDLNFQQNRYESKHVITFKNPKPAVLAALRESGPVPGDENGLKSKRAQDESSKKKKRIDKNIDMERLADGLQKLGEDDLLQVVQMVHDNKSADSYTKNDIEQGEFHVDLYTLPDTLIKMLWDFSQEKGVV